MCGDHALLAMLPSIPFPGWFRLRRPGILRQMARLPRSFILLKYEGKDTRPSSSNPRTLTSVCVCVCVVRVRGWVWFATLLYPQLLLGVAITFLAFYSSTHTQVHTNTERHSPEPPVLCLRLWLGVLSVCL